MGDEWKKERGAYFVRPFLGPSVWDYPGGEYRTSGFGIQLSKLKLKRNWKKKPKRKRRNQRRQCCQHQIGRNHTTWGGIFCFWLRKMDQENWSWGSIWLRCDSPQKENVWEIPGACCPPRLLPGLLLRCELFVLELLGLWGSETKWWQSWAELISVL